MQRVTAKVLNWKIFPFDKLIDELIVCQKMPSSIVALLPFSNSLSLSFKALYFPWRRKRASSWHGKATADFDSVIDRIIVSWVWCITFIFCALALTKYRRWIGQKECVYRENILSLTSWVLLEIGTLLILTPILFRLPNAYLLLRKNLPEIEMFGTYLVLLLKNGMF